MVRREHDIDLIHRIANSDAVRPFIRPDGEAMDFSPIAGKSIADAGGILLSNGEDALAIFEQTTPHPTIWMMHTLFGATCRGRKAIDTAKEMFAWMWAHGAEIIWGVTDKANRKACWFNRAVGGSVIASDIETYTFELRRPA